MTSVKEQIPQDELQVALLMGLLFREITETFAAEDWDGLRQSHFRVISAVPEGGISVTELGERLGMSKQGCGQFVTQLEQSGHLRTEADPADRRVRRVHRTPRGHGTIAAVTAPDAAARGRLGRDRGRAALPHLPHGCSRRSPSADPPETALF